MVSSSEKVNIWPFAFGYACNGAIVSMPGANLQEFLKHTDWNPAGFGFALLLQGVCSYLGTRFLAEKLSRCGATRSLGLCAGFQLVGLLLVYMDIQNSWHAIGFALIGLSVGNISILGSLAGLYSPNPQQKLNQLNLAFTGGAVVVPILTSVLRQWPDHHLNWRWPLICTVVCLATLISRALFFTQQVSKVLEPKSARIAAQKISFLHSATLICACLGLFLYVGIEINLSNSWVGLMPDQNNASLISWASPLFWAGLFLSRLIFSVKVPEEKNLSKWLCTFALGALLSLVSVFLARLGIWPIKTSTFLGLFCAFFSGLSIGSSYSFILGAATFNAPLNLKTLYASRASEWGVLGTIALPPLIGMAEQWGHKPGVLLFLTISVALLLTANIGLVKNQGCQTLGTKA